jgi:hypothetical protein
MTKIVKVDGKYQIKGNTYDSLVGSRAQVWHRNAYKTTGSLKRDNLVKNKSGRIVSKSKSVTAKKDNRLVKHGFGTKKGTFGYVKITTKKTKGKKNKKTKKNKRK